MTDLERRYRRLLYAFPAHYRRRRGDEMLATLLDCAPPGAARPAVREAAVLVLAGLRCRLRLRPGPMTRIAAIVAVFVGAVLTGTAGSWLGWQGAEPLPDVPTAAAIARVAVPLAPDGQHRDDFLFRVRPSDSDYEIGAVTFTYAGTREDVPSPVVAAARERLRTEGWSVGEVRSTADGRTSFAARSGDVQVAMHDDGGTAELRIIRAQPDLVPVLMIGGLLLGGLVGWLVSGWVSQRIADTHPARQAAVIVGSTVALAAMFPASFYCLVPVIRGYVDEGAMEPPWTSMYLLGLRQLTALGIAVALVVVCVGALPQRGRDRATVPV